ncbi:MAG: tetratricopeptide repeat protein [Nitrospinota bacterium]|jgi:tetratricopeptide (TPR) repeat protein|nr:tetratricopeptide repeat protein [Nitrospinota bacterium]HJN02399.1 tetratricopeptide repeat protein [Nitrospinota bacterium]
MTLIKDRRQAIFLIFLFFSAFSIRIIYLSEFHHKNPLFDIIPSAFDHSNFDKGAINFSKGDLLARSSNNSYAPLYKYFLGIIYLLFGRSFDVIYLIQFSMGSLSAILIYLIAKEHFGFRAGVIAFTGFAFYSPQIIYEGIILRAAFISFFGVLSFYLLSRLKFSLSTANLIISALALSLFIQGRPNVILCLPFVFVFLHKNIRFLKPEERIRYWLTFTVTLLLSFIPLLVQCYLVHDKFVFFDASGPHTFISGNIISYSGVGFDQAIVENYRRKNILGYLSNIDFLFHHILNDFSGFIKLYLRKLYYFFNDFEAPTNISIYLYRKLSAILPLLLGHFSLYSSLGLMGLLLAIKNKKQTFLLYSYIFSLSVSVIIFLNESRYRIPVVPYFIIFSSYTIHLTISWISQKKFKNTIIAVSIAITLFTVFLEPKANVVDRIRAEDYNNMATAWKEKGNLEKAVSYLDKAIATDPFFSFSYFNKGQYFLKKQDWENAIFYFEKAFFFNKGHIESKNKLMIALFGLGDQYLKKEKYKNAIGIYSKIQMLDSQNIDALLNMGVCYAYMGEESEAKKLFESILKIDPDHSAAKTNLGLL